MLCFLLLLTVNLIYIIACTPRNLVLPNVSRFFFSLSDLRCLQVEKEKQDPESPRGALEACLNRCSISSSEDPPQNKEAIENADVDVRCKNHRASSNWGKFFKLWKRRSMKRLSSFPPLSCAPVISKRNKNADPDVDDLNLHDIYDFQSSLHSFSITDLEIATDYFNPGNES